jgi:hypothetical protein
VWEFAPLSHQNALWHIRALITAACFLLYAGMALSLHQPESISYPNEEIGPLPAAVSQWTLGGQGGLIDSGILDYFLQAYKAHTPVSQAVEEAVKGSAQPSGKWVVAIDGQGVGDIIATGLGFALFGPHAVALPLFYLVLIGASTACFVIRYRDQRMMAAPILLLSLSLLLFSPFLTGAAAPEAPIGGIRYYAIVGLLPALHWCFEFGEMKAPCNNWQRWALLTVQLSILGLAILVRGSPLYLILPVVGFYLFTIVKKRGAWRRNTMYLALPAVALATCLVLLPRIAFPDYAANGRLHVELWHKIFIGFGSNEAWPFAGVRDAYPCPEIPEGIVRGVVDRNGQCAWSSARLRNPTWSSKPFSEGLYSGDYEDAMRDATFRVISEHPREAFVTFFYSKPQHIGKAIISLLPSFSSKTTQFLLPLFLIEIALLAILIYYQTDNLPHLVAYRSMFVLMPFLLAVQLPLILAWANAVTILDLMALVLCGVVVCLIFCISSMISLARHGFQLWPSSTPVAGKGAIGRPPSDGD